MYWRVSLEVSLGIERPSGRAENKSRFHHHLGNNYVNPPMPLFNRNTRDRPEVLSNPGVETVCNKVQCTDVFYVQTLRLCWLKLSTAVKWAVERTSQSSLLLLNRNFTNKYNLQWKDQYSKQRLETSRLSSAATSVRSLERCAHVNKVKTDTEGWISIKKHSDIDRCTRHI